MDVVDTATVKEAYRTESLLPFLAQLGKMLIKDPRNAEWMDVNEICTFCRERGIKVNGDYPSASELEPALREMFSEREEICTEGINVTAFLRRVKWDQVMVVTFFRDVHSTPMNPVVVEAEHDTMIHMK